MHGSFASVLLCFHVRLCSDLHCIALYTLKPPKLNKNVYLCLGKCNILYKCKIGGLSWSAALNSAKVWVSDHAAAGGFFFPHSFCSTKKKEKLSLIRTCVLVVKRCGQLCGFHTEWCLILTAWRTDGNPRPRWDPSVSRRENREGRWPSRPSDESSPPFVPFFCAAEQTRAH